MLTDPSQHLATDAYNVKHTSDTQVTAASGSAHTPPLTSFHGNKTENWDDTRTLYSGVLSGLSGLMERGPSHNPATDPDEVEPLTTTQGRTHEGHRANDWAVSAKMERHRVAGGSFLEVINYEFTSKYLKDSWKIAIPLDPADSLGNSVVPARLSESVFSKHVPSVMTHQLQSLATAARKRRGESDRQQFQNPDIAGLIELARKAEIALPEPDEPSSSG